MNWKEYLKGFRFFWKGLKAAGREMWVSLEVLILLTLILSTLLYFVEHAAQPEVYTNWWDAFVWSFMGYLGNPGKFATGDPITLLGRFLWIAIAIVKIMIFAVPAGLVASGFSKAMAKDKRDKELEKYHKIMLRSFNVLENRDLKLYLQNNVSQDEKAWYHGVKFKFIANNINVAKLLLKGVDLKDVLDVCERYPEFRVKNEAAAKSEEEGKVDRYMLEYFPVNRSYGYFVNRGSKVTIVSTSSRAELGTGNFSYYLAKYAGFNYISKDFDIDINNPESFFNNRWEEPKIDNKTLQERLDAGEKVSKEERELYEKKKKLRTAFLEDLESLAQGEDSWVICILSQVQVEGNPVNVHIAHTVADGSEDTIHDQERFQKLVAQLTETMQNELQQSVEETSRFPLLKRKDSPYRNILYKLQDDGCKCNGMTMRISAHLMLFDSRMRVALFLMAKTIKEALEPDKPLDEKEIKDLNRTGFGFSEHELKQ